MNRYLMMAIVLILGISAVSVAASEISEFSATASEEEDDEILPMVGYRDPDNRLND